MGAAWWPEGEIRVVEKRAYVRRGRIPLLSLRVCMRVQLQGNPEPTKHTEFGLALNLLPRGEKVLLVRGSTGRAALDSKCKDRRNDKITG